jgi:DNA-binding response OmpR family regulator
LSQVLLVDDNPSQLSLRETILRQAGFHLSAATTAESALATLRVFGDQVGVVVTDHIMPGCSGVELVRQIRAIKPDLPVIVLSGLPEAESEYRGLDVIFRRKPLPPPELIELVRSSLPPIDDRSGVAQPLS